MTTFTQSDTPFMTPEAFISQFVTKDKERKWTPYWDIRNEVVEKEWLFRLLRAIPNEAKDLLNRPIVVDLVGTRIGQLTKDEFQIIFGLLCEDLY